MAQDFERHIARSTGTSGATIFTSNSDDAIISIRLANIVSGTITADCFITNGGNDYYLVKDAPVPAGGSLELIDGGSKVVLMSGDRLLGQCGTANGIDAWISTVDAVST